MLEILDWAGPSAENFSIVMRGMRAPFKGQDKCDSKFEFVNPGCHNFKFGENDKNLAKRLISGGSPHDKFLRQLPVTLEIKAPLYWWKQIDQYKVGTVTDSESTMHTMTKYPFTMEDFSLDYLGSKRPLVGTIVDRLNKFRDIYLDEATSDIKKQASWNAINELLPQSYYQTRVWSGSYRNILDICSQRYTHKLEEWHILIQFCLDNLPYFGELCYDKLCELPEFQERYEYGSIDMV